MKEFAFPSFFFLLLPLHLSEVGSSFSSVGTEELKNGDSEREGGNSNNAVFAFHCQRQKWIEARRKRKKQRRRGSNRVKATLAFEDVDARFKESGKLNRQSIAKYVPVPTTTKLGKISTL